MPGQCRLPDIGTGIGARIHHSRRRNMQPGRMQTSILAASHTKHSLKRISPPERTLLIRLGPLKLVAAQHQTAGLREVCESQPRQAGGAQTCLPLN